MDLIKIGTPVYRFECKIKRDKSFELTVKKHKVLGLNKDFICINDRHFTKFAQENGDFINCYPLIDSIDSGHSFTFDSIKGLMAELHIGAFSTKLTDFNLIIDKFKYSINRDDLIKKTNLENDIDDIFKNILNYMKENIKEEKICDISEEN